MDPRLNAFRPDLADERLRDRVEAKRYVAGHDAIVTAGLAPVRRGPSLDAPLGTFYHYGEPVRVFESGADYAWCQSQFDCYVGYVEARHIAIGPAPVPTHFVASMGSYRYAEPDLRSPVIDFLPRHSAVAVAESRIITRGTEYARLASEGFVPLRCLSSGRPNSTDFVTAAERYLGCPYLWGGKSFLGIDCSGLVQNAFRDLGVTVLRDTDMQRGFIGSGVTIASIAELERGDLIYIPGHVLIYAGDGAVIHADGGSMMVRRDDLAALMRDRNLRLSDFTIRRDPTASRA
ncbi:MAG TPA: NlpC/P60 family protein [Stellaceae bacterium]|nr:NlpC/P60 family protein [Stellaceae bacterium]